MLEIKFEKGFPKDHWSLKEGDVFFVESDKFHVFMVLKSNYVFKLTSTNPQLYSVSDFHGKSLVVVRKATVSLEV